MRFVLGLLMMGLSLSAEAAAPKECGFVPRAMIRDLMSELPESVIGWVSCYEKNPALGVFLVARFENGEKAKQEAFLLSLAKLTVPDGKSSTVTQIFERKKDVREILVETKRAQSDSQLHYSFSTPVKGGGQLVFVHAKPARETRKQWLAITGVRDRMSAPSMVEHILSQHARGDEIAHAVASGNSLP